MDIVGIQLSRTQPGYFDLPITETIAPKDQDEVCKSVRDAFEAEAAIYPLGGETSLGYGF